MKIYKVLAINLGSSSTKVAYYENENCLFNENIQHSSDDLQKFNKIWDQYDYRVQSIENFIKDKNIRIEDLDAVSTRGGHTHPIEGGVYKITERMLEESASEKYGNHATDLGLKVANEFSKKGPVAFTVDPPSTDEFEPLARFSGHPKFSRRSSFHALNHRAVAHQFAKDNKLDYEDLSLITAHLGGGVTVAVHKNGRMIDANNGLDGDGPFSTNRTGGLPIGNIVDYCFNSKLTIKEIHRMINGKGGLYAYLGETDIRRIEEKSKEDKDSKLTLEAMCYQISKEIAADASVLRGKVDAIILTGGMANSLFITEYIREHVSFIAPVILYPGEYEMQSLALNVVEALRGREEIKELK